MKMKKILLVLAAAVTMLAACTPNLPQTPEEQGKIAFAKAHFFEVLGVNVVPSEEYEQDSVRALAYVRDSAVVIELYGVGFSSRMPLTVDMAIMDIDYSRSADKITLSGDSIIPMMGSRPFDRYIITNLEGYITADSLVITNNYGSYENCRYAGKVIKMEESDMKLDE